MNMKLTAVMVIVGILLVVSIVQTFQVNGLKNKISATGAAIAGAGNGALDMSGWTANEIMNYEMHGTIPARLEASVHQLEVLAEWWEDAEYGKRS